MVELFKALNLSDSGSWASIISVLLTFATFLMLWGIKKKFIFRSSVDDHMNKINDISSKISSLLKSFTKNQHHIEESFALADVALRAMQKGASGDLLKDIKNSRSMIKKYKMSKNEDSAREIKKQLSVVLTELFHHRKSLITGT